MTSDELQMDLGTTIGPGGTPPNTTNADIIAMQRAIQALANNVNTLTQAVTRFINNAASNPSQPMANISSTTGTKVVEKPERFKGKGSERARLFRNAFLVWAHNNQNAFALRNDDGTPRYDDKGVVRLDPVKLITSALSFMDDTAAEGARPHIELLASKQPVFDNNWDEFIKQFKAKFEPIDAQAEAKLKLVGLKQGTRTFNAYLSEFKTWSPRTGWSDIDLFDRLKSGLNSVYLERLSYFQPLATNLSTLEDYGSRIDLALKDLKSARMQP